MFEGKKNELRRGGRRGRGTARAGLFAQIRECVCMFVSVPVLQEMISV